jgi:hypothetical protein
MMLRQDLLKAFFTCNNYQLSEFYQYEQLILTFIVYVEKGPHNIQHSDTQHNNTQYNNTQHNNTQHKGDSYDTSISDIQHRHSVLQY